MSTITPPPVTLEDLHAFQAKHFPGSVPSPAYQEQPLEEEQQEEYYEEDDDLGYYPDGAKRTLTDEQIRIFRHSEVHALLREKQLREEAEAEAEEEREQARLDAAAKLEKHSSAAAEGKTTTLAAVASSGVGGTQARSLKQTRSEEDTAMNYGDEDVSVAAPSRSYEESSSRRPSQFAGRRIISYED
ncbi:hypothetical protein BO70DRAFT_350496 [Aspergillus heteromorphus CBS 117.55]|uniref:Uncharacterized protein n=1 Tax=Aspergillus heteromorphus CBS 117.55 TaxID=1448321 RepID=A0A317WVP6_9EURO|nr:uncharacterized protein BO70DRAFT_350496 [Aspergillus heteromorphus CBS 117.55]PWY89297.1 hypothetical protein BO70DRAFT_350496 [Aspergillus heteromorphus CBS 117.55]